MIDLNSIVTQRQFGEIVGISQPAVSDLLSREVIREGQTLGQWLTAYCAHLRETAAGRAALGELDLATERARVAREQADKLAMQNAVTRDELKPALVIEMVLSRTAAKVTGLFDGITGRIRRRFPDLPTECINLIGEEVAKIRNIVAGLSLSDIQDFDGIPGVDNEAEPMESDLP